MQNNDARIAIYSRKSKFTGKGESIGNQVELCRDYVRNMFGRTYGERCDIFEDEGFSGGNLNRPDFRRMMEEVRKRRYKAIVVYRLDRISRNICDFTSLIDELTRLDVAFVSIREQFDTSTPMGRAMMFIISVFSQLERETIAERIRDNMHELAKTGRWLGGNTPTGYESECVSKQTVDGKIRRFYKLTPIPEEAEIVKTIFDLYCQTDSLTATETEMLRRRIKTKRGKDFTRFALKAILQNPVYAAADLETYDYFSARGADVCSEKGEYDGKCGIMAYNRTDQEKGRSAVLLPTSQWIIAVGNHIPLIPANQWIRVQESLERNKSHAYRKPRSNEALLTGLLFCACGERMYPKLSQRTAASGEIIYTYVCKMKERSKGERCWRRNANGNGLDGAVLRHIKTLMEDSSSFVIRLEKSRKLLSGKEDPNSVRLAEIRSEYAENERKVAGLIDALGLTEQSVAKAHILKRVEELVQANREIEEQVLALEQQAASSLSDSESNLLYQMLAELPSIIDHMSVEEKRWTLRAMIHKIVWDGENAHVVLYGAEPDNGRIDPPVNALVRG